MLYFLYFVVYVNIHLYIVINIQYIVNIQIVCNLWSDAVHCLVKEIFGSVMKF